MVLFPGFLMIRLIYKKKLFLTFDYYFSGQLQVPQDVLASSNGSEAAKSSNTFEMSPLLTGSSTSEMKDSIITLDYVSIIL